MPSASSGGKNQITQPHLVVMTSNRNIDEIDTKLTDTAYNALVSRMLVFDFCDDAFDPRRPHARQNQSHRKADFSHISFRRKNKEYNVDQLVDAICQRIGKSIDNFQALNAAEVQEYPYMYHGKPLSVDKNCAADDMKYLHWFAGLPGTGKSRSVIPHVKELTQHLNVKLYIPTTIDALQANTPKIGDVFSR